MDTENKKYQVKNISAWSLLVVWALLSIVLLWNIFRGDYQAFADTDTLTNTDSNNLIAQVTLAPGKRARVVHFIDDKCSCTKYSLPHIAEIEQEFPNAQHVKVRSNSVGTGLSNSTFDWAIASPSVAIFSSSGELTYYGPYTDAAVCGQGNSIVDSVMNALERKEEFQWVNLLAYGCYCDWPKTDLSHSSNYKSV